MKTNPSVFALRGLAADSRARLPISPGTRRITLVLAIVTLLVTGYLVHANRWRFLEPRVAYAYGNPDRDYSDVRRLVGQAPNVWVGLVLEDLGPLAEEGKWIRTQLKVRVLEVLKGDLDREVTVRQIGGLDKRENTIRLFDRDPIMRPGEIVMFASGTHHEQAGAWENLFIARYGNVRITSPQIQAELLVKYRRAIQEQITLDDEIAEIERHGDESGESDAN